MKSANVLVASLAILSFAAPATAGPGWAPSSERIVRARVVDVQPMYRTIEVTEPERICRTREVPMTSYERIPRHTNGTAGATIAGGVIGGALGSQFGRGSGRIVTGAFGALVGASLGHGISHGYTDDVVQVREVSEVRECRTIERTRLVERIEAYRVTYRFRGFLETAVVDHDPGTWIEVRVDARPVAH